MIEKVSLFIQSFIQREYELRIDSLRKNGEKNTYINKVTDFLNQYVIGGFHFWFSELEIWNDSRTEEEVIDYIKDVFRRRKLFLIEHRRDVKFDVAILEQGIKTEDIFLCYVSKNSESWNNYYYGRFVIAMDNNNDFKIITIENSRKGEWEDPNDLKRVLDYGQFVEAMKIEAPSKAANLEHYNSF